MGVHHEKGVPVYIPALKNGGWREEFYTMKNATFRKDYEARFVTFAGLKALAGLNPLYVNDSQIKDYISVGSATLYRWENTEPYKEAFQKEVERQRAEMKTDSQRHLTKLKVDCGIRILLDDKNLYDKNLKIMRDFSLFLGLCASPVDLCASKADSDKSPLAAQLQALLKALLDDRNKAAQKGPLNPDDRSQLDALQNELRSQLDARQLRLFDALNKAVRTVELDMKTFLQELKDRL